MFGRLTGGGFRVHGAVLVLLIVLSIFGAITILSHIRIV